MTRSGPDPGARGHAFRAFQHRSFAIFWSGALLSNIGTWLSNLTVPYVLFQLTGSAVWTGIASLAQFGPQMVLTPLAGSLADRFDRRRILLITQSGMALGTFAMWLVWLLAGDRENSAYVLLALVALIGAMQGINLPSWQAFVNDLVPRRDLASAIALNSLQFNAARSIGPAIAGLLLAAIGATWAFFFNAVSYVAVIVSLLLVRWDRVKPRTHDLTEKRTGFLHALRYVGTQPGIVIAIVVSFLVGVLANPILNFTVVFADSVFHVGAIALGLLNATFGLGSVLAAPIVASPRTTSRAATTRAGLLLSGLGLVGFALAPNAPVAMAFLVLVGAGFMATIASANTSLQMIVAPRLRGRVIAVRLMIYSGSFPLGALVQTALSDAVGPRPVVTVAGILFVVLFAVLGFGPGWRRLAHLDDPPDDPDLRAAM